MNYLQEKCALSEQGAKDLFNGIIYSALAYISLILPVALLAYVLNAFLSPLLRRWKKHQRSAVYSHWHHYSRADLPAALYAIHSDLLGNLSGK